LVTYNINELLEEKKAIEEQVEEKLSFNPGELSYIKKETIDYTNPDNSTEFIPKEKIDLKEFTQEFYGLVERLAGVKEAIQKYNAEQILGLLQKRDSVRTKITYLDLVKQNLNREKQSSTRATRKGKENETLEAEKTTIEPMFPLKDVETQYNNLAAQERQLNTEIQKKNLDAKITLEKE